jgi:pyruvate dehydrogenase E2 component (dihydrolipoamide acetyltransferase)
MATKVIMPKQGLQMTEGTIVEWKVSEGDSVEDEQAILEIETDKLSIDVNAPAGGVLLKILHGQGDVVPVTEMIGIIGEEGEDISALLEEAGKESAAPAPAPAAGAPSKPDAAPAAAAVKATGRAPGEKVYASPRAKWRAEEKGIDVNALAGSGPEGLVIERDVVNAPASASLGAGPAAAATPLARKVASIHDVDLRAVKGSGTGGRITKVDVMETLHTSKVESAEIGGQEGFLVAHSTMRKSIAKRMSGSLHTAAQANHRMEVDVTELVRIREKLKAAEKKVSYTDMLIKITSAALRDVPILNSSWTDEGVFIKQDINIGMAVALDEGLIVPVVRGADMLGLEEIHARTRELIDKVKQGALEQYEMEGGTFTITNLGMFDIDSFTAIINQPESGILAVGRIKETPAAVNGEVEIRPLMTLSLTYDHRVVDGAPAAKFLQRMKQYIETPYLLL